jgi:DNA-binding NarL/FixJ family response regulator
LAERGCSKRAIARQLGVDEKAVRYRLARLPTKRAQEDGVLLRCQRVRMRDCELPAAVLVECLHV